MSKKFSIVKEIDLDKLRKQIELYRYETGESNPYLFMNNKTIKQICDTGIPDLTIYKTLGRPIVTYNSNNLIGFFEGYKVFGDNTLSFGEVEIRQEDIKIKARLMEVILRVEEREYIKPEKVSEEVINAINIVKEYCKSHEEFGYLCR